MTVTVTARSAAIVYPSWKSWQGSGTGIARSCLSLRDRDEQGRLRSSESPATVLLNRQQAQNAAGVVTVTARIASICHAHQFESRASTVSAVAAGRDRVFDGYN